MQFTVLPGRGVPSAHYRSAYATFHTVWQETLRGIRGSDYVQHSNDFTRQDFIQTLFDDAGNCVALDCVRAVQLDNPVDLADSWLEAWPAEILRELAAEHTTAWINSYFTVHPDHRRTLCHDAHPVSYVLGCLSVLHQLELRVPLMLGMMRCDRSMNALGKRIGAATLDTITYNGVETDLVVFRTAAVLETSRKFPSIVFELSDRGSARSEERHHERYA